MTATGVSRREAFDMAGLTPSRLLGFEAIELKQGSRADRVLFHLDGPGSPLEIKATIFRGEVRHGTVTG